MPLALTACGGDDAAVTDKLAATEVAAKRAEDAAKRAEDAAKAVKFAGSGTVYANDPSPSDAPVAPPQTDVQNPRQAVPDAGNDMSAGLPRTPA